MNTPAICAMVVEATALFAFILAGRKLNGLEITPNTSYLSGTTPGENPKYDAELALIRKSRRPWRWVLGIAVVVFFLGFLALALLTLTK